MEYRGAHHVLLFLKSYVHSKRQLKIVLQDTAEQDTRSTEIPIKQYVNLNFPAEQDTQTEIPP